MLGFRSLPKIILLAILPLAVEATPVTYTYAGKNFTYAGNTDPTRLPYNVSSKVQLTFTSDEVLIPSTSVLLTVTAWSMTDGTQTFTSSDGVSAPSFQVTPSLSAGKVFDYWEIFITPPCANCFISINTTNAADGRVYDWGQNETFNYGGNWNSPGTWSAASQVPEPGTTALTLIALGVLGLTTRRRKS